MYVGVARIVIQIPGARSLKDRRSVVRSFKERLKARLKVSAAEVGDPNKLQVANLGVSVVSSDASVCHELIDSVRSMASSLPEAVLADFRSEVFSFAKPNEQWDLPPQPQSLGLPWETDEDE